MDFIAKPFGWLLMVLYQFFNNYGLAVIVFALIVKGILLPFQMKSKRGTMQQTRLQPKIKELEKKHGANKQKYNEEVAKLYKEEKINPASGCLWSLIPLPIIIALFSAVSKPLTIMMGVASDLVNKGGTIYNMVEQLGVTLEKSRYPQIEMAKVISDPANFNAFHAVSSSVHTIDYHFLGMMLGDTPKWNFLWTTNWNDSSVWVPGLLLFLLAISSGVLTYVSSMVSMKINPSMNMQQQGSMKSMMLMMPLMSLYFAFYMPGGISVYIISSTLFAMVQDIILTKHYTRVLEAEDAVKLERNRIRDAELEAKRLETERKKLENATEVNPNTSKQKQQKTEKQKQLAKAVEWEKKHAGEKQEIDPARSGDRRFARGRAYDPNRYETTDDTVVAIDTEESDVEKSAVMNTEAVTLIEAETQAAPDATGENTDNKAE